MSDQVEILKYALEQMRKTAEAADRIMEENLKRKNQERDAVLELVKSLNLSSRDVAFFAETMYFTQGDQVMTKNQNNVRIGNNANISGNFVIADSITNSFNKVDNSPASADLKILIKELSEALGKIVENLPVEEATKIAKDMDKLADEVAQDKPDPNYWRVSVDGLKKAAEKLGEVGKPVLDIVSKIVPLLLALAG